MATTRTRIARMTLIAFLLSGSAAIGANKGKGQQNNTSTPEALYYYEFTGANADEVSIPAGLVSDKLIMVYQHKFGNYPFISRDGVVSHGGVPQRTKMAAHLREIARDIEEQIPDPDFDGFVVIDYEGWRPFWEDTPGEYKALSRELVRQKNPNWDDAKVERKARTSYEAAAKKLLSRTLDKCHSMRPKASWGVFGYPMGNMRDNVNARWFWDRQDAFFPEIYMQYSLVPDDVEPSLGEQREGEYIRDRLEARVGFARELAGDRPVLPVVWPRYRKTNPDEALRYQPLKQSDLAMTLEGPLSHGADAVVIWENLPMPELAAEFQIQIDESIAPELERILTDRGLPTDGSAAGAADETGTNADDDRRNGAKSGSNKNKKKKKKNKKNKKSKGDNDRRRGG